MLKTLLAISSLSTLGTASINSSLISSYSVTNKEKVNYIESLDHISYDISIGSMIYFKLPDMLEGIKYLNNLHRESGKEIKLFGLPSWWAIADDGKIIAQNIIEGGSAFLNLNYLINSDQVIFNEISFILWAGTKSQVWITLKYQIADIYQDIPLFSFKSINTFPLQQNDLKVQGHFNFEEPEQ